MNPSDTELDRRLTDTLRAVAELTEASPTSSFESIRADLDRPTSRPPSRLWVGAALAAAAAIAVLALPALRSSFGPSPDQRVEIGPAETVPAPLLYALATSPPEGFTVAYASAQRTDLDQPDCVGCLDLWVVPADRLPIGPSAFIAIAVEPPGFANLVDAEQLSVRGREATLGRIGSTAKLAWQEADGVSVVITFDGYSREELLAVAEGLTIEGMTQGDVSAGVVPDGSVAVGADVASELTIVGYTTDDGRRLTVNARRVDVSVTEEARERLRTGPVGDRLIERPTGVGLAGTQFDAPFDDNEVVWWTTNGLLLTITGDQNPLDVDEVADLAATFEEVTEAEWVAAGGT